MEEWKEYKIKDVTSVLGDGIHGTPKYDENGSVFFINGNNLENGKIVIRENTKRVSFEEAAKHQKPLNDRTIFVSINGTLGNVARYNGEPCILGKSACYFNVKEEFDIDFIYYVVANNEFRKEIERLATGTTIKNVSLETMRNYTFFAPSRLEQKKVASILKSLDDKIEVNRRINENLEQQAQALFKSWFVDFEPFKDQPFVESELGMIPQGWRVGSLDDVCCFISRGLTPKYDESSDELILGQTCVRNNIVTLNNARRHRPKSKTEKWVQQWDVLLNSTGIGSLGRVGVVYFKMDNVAIDSHITVVRTSKPLYRHYVGRNLLSRQLEIENMAVGSTGQTELPRDRVKALPIIIPSGDVLGKFNDIIEPIALQMYRNIDESRRLAELRDTLLPRLMSGELHVNDM